MLNIVNKHRLSKEIMLYLECRITEKQLWLFGQWGYLRWWHPKGRSQYTFNEQRTGRQLLRMRRLRESTVLLPSKTSDNSRYITNLDGDDNKNSLFYEIICLYLYFNSLFVNIYYYGNKFLMVWKISNRRFVHFNNFNRR